MTVFGTIIAHNFLWCQYRNRAGLAKTQGPIMVGVVWVANALSILGLYLYTQMDYYRFKDPIVLNRLMWEWLQAFKLAFFSGSLLIFLLGYFFYRIRPVYQHIITETLSNTEERQKLIAKRGFRYFIGSILVLILIYAVLIWLFIQWGFLEVFRLSTN
ncbi:hypothetical protein [Sediminibacterium sp.]|uniref:hypothetical protein n=1 Tax=Sediminibacterium sp. TaxID=1917865 RepID=UPI003F6996C1